MRGPNMSYCAAENTAAALDQVVDMVSEGGEEYISNLSTYEKTGHLDLIQLCQAYLKLMENHVDNLSRYETQ